MRKRIFFLTAVLLFHTLLPGCAKTDLSEVRQLYVDRLSLARSAEELPEVSDLIVVFTPESQENVLKKYADGNVSVGYTRTAGTAAQVLAGPASEGDSILITEECYTTGFGSVLWTQGGYLPMDIGGRYLLFLKAYDVDSIYAGMYFPVDLEYGKYAVSPSGEASYTAEQLEIGPCGDLERYCEWLAAVQTLYPDVF